MMNKTPDILMRRTHRSPVPSSIITANILCLTLCTWYGPMYGDSEMGA